MKTQNNHRSFLCAMLLCKNQGDVHTYELPWLSLRQHKKSLDYLARVKHFKMAVVGKTFLQTLPPSLILFRVQILSKYAKTKKNQAFLVPPSFMHCTLAAHVTERCKKTNQDLSGRTEKPLLQSSLFLQFPKIYIVFYSLFLFFYNHLISGWI